MVSPFTIPIGFKFKWHPDWKVQVWGGEFKHRYFVVFTHDTNSHLGLMTTWTGRKDGRSTVTVCFLPYLLGHRYFGCISHCFFCLFWVGKNPKKVINSLFMQGLLLEHSNGCNDPVDEANSLDSSCYDSINVLDCIGKVWNFQFQPILIARQ